MVLMVSKVRPEELAQQAQLVFRESKELQELPETQAQLVCQAVPEELVESEQMVRLESPVLREIPAQLVCLELLDLKG